MGLFDFYGQFSFYGAYHNDKGNQWVHIIFVPTISWTVLVWLAAYGPLVEFAAPAFVSLLPACMSDGFIINPAFVVALLYTTYYIILEPIAGALYAPFMMSLWLSATHFQLTNPNFVAITIGVHIFSWLMQFASHAFLEGRKPALIDNIAQAFLMAPFFVWMEVLFKLGYRPTLRKKLDATIAAKVAELNAADKVKKRN
mmetsp:Transcript_17779/g.45266  ORF Transcript_17779/g.45266 Transcript_17779/m.45266 type:complete len:199 (+) Transcript_17779:119-715(+)|eukprot:CAMPEP_0177654610 /NCGR_PEP_ID=MMETSP0447-20121125/14438_1 /TAXON_ID=0 /ORGANISM="Stygamoeba regulata, Strain BSH-02190019" /LENGTH=198 /DNA_ID=CAMNT_0019158299 /DNA_START=52 /DNA_END=648 /DNA_ORIENTATION=+